MQYPTSRRQRSCPGDGARTRTADATTFLGLDATCGTGLRGERLPLVFGEVAYRAGRKAVQYRGGAPVTIGEDAGTSGGIHHVVRVGGMRKPDRMTGLVHG